MNKIIDQLLTELTNEVSKANAESYPNKLRDILENISNMTDDIIDEVDRYIEGPEDMRDER
jgi:hypothetical protein